MEDADFSDEFCRFVQAHLGSVEAAEALIGAARDPEAGLREAGAGKHAQSLRAGGLLDQTGRYHPANEELARHVATLVKAYEERPVTLIRLIYALRDRKIQSFADAFKLRRS